MRVAMIKAGVDHSSRRGGWQGTRGWGEEKSFERLAHARGAYLASLQPCACIDVHPGSCVCAAHTPLLKRTTKLLSEGLKREDRRSTK